jgi:Uma2 family endonuclease
MEAIQPDKHYTYADYCTWNDGKRYELINGTAYLMEPAPKWEHQDIALEIGTILRTYFRGKTGKAFVAPFDVRLNAEAEDDIVLQPDIVVFCDRSKLSGTGCIGAPDMVVEILSPSTASYDKLVKYNHYLQAGVREYWIVDPDSKTVLVHILENERYHTVVYAETDEAPVQILDGCVIKLSEIFAGISR